MPRVHAVGVAAHLPGLAALERARSTGGRRAAAAARCGTSCTRSTCRRATPWGRCCSSRCRTRPRSARPRRPARRRTACGTGRTGSAGSFGSLGCVAMGRPGAIGVERLRAGEDDASCRRASRPRSQWTYVGIVGAGQRLHLARLGRVPGEDAARRVEDLEEAVVREVRDVERLVQRGEDVPARRARRARGTRSSCAPRACRRTSSR